MPHDHYYPIQPREHTATDLRRATWKTPIPDMPGQCRDNACETRPRPEQDPWSPSIHGYADRHANRHSGVQTDQPLLKPMV
jgi:hypothetical protein